MARCNFKSVSDAVLAFRNGAKNELTHQQTQYCAIAYLVDAGANLQDLDLGFKAATAKVYGSKIKTAYKYGLVYEDLVELFTANDDNGRSKTPQDVWVELRKNDETYVSRGPRKIEDDSEDDEGADDDAPITGKVTANEHLNTAMASLRKMLEATHGGDDTVNASTVREVKAFRNAMLSEMAR